MTTETKNENAMREMRGSAWAKETASGKPELPQPGTEDIQAALDRQKAYTRKLHGEMQSIIHHKSCRPADRDLVWHCNQCGLNEPDTYAEALAEALRCLIRDTRLYCNPDNTGIMDTEIDAAQHALAKWEAGQ